MKTKTKREQLSAEALKKVQAQIASAMIYQAHFIHLNKDKAYLSAYAKQLGLTEKEFLKIANGKYNGKMSKLIEICLRNGIAPVMGWDRPKTQKGSITVKVKKPSKAEANKTQFTRIALGLAGLPVNDKVAELIWRVNELMKKKKGNFDLKDGGDVERKVWGNNADIKIVAVDRKEKE